MGRGGERAVKTRMTRLADLLRKSSSVLLDTAGIILLSGSASLWWGVAAGAAALGLGCFVMNYRVNGGT
jgi:hypothetical protein